jgi:hypothetical protein
MGLGWWLGLTVATVSGKPACSSCRLLCCQDEYLSTNLQRYLFTLVPSTKASEGSTSVQYQRLETRPRSRLNFLLVIRVERLQRNRCANA